MVGGPRKRGRHVLRLLIADDDAGVRNSIKRVLERDPDTEVIGEAADGVEAVRLARALHPGLVLMDISMPQMNGLEALRLTKQAWPDTKIIMVTIHDEEQYRAVATAGGADGFVLKKALGTELLPTIRRVTAR
jgi:two-component system, NarL family, response regulator DegU